MADLNHDSVDAMLCPMPSEPAVTRTRSIVKALTYRAAIICLDFVALYLMTGKTAVAVGFMLVSNVYTTVAYFLHERAWEHVRWGRVAPSSS